MRHGKDRRLWILVDGDDLGRFFHSRSMLHGAAYGHGDVERRAHRSACLADLVFLADVAAIDGSATGADRSTDRTGQIVNHLEIFFAADPPAASHDHPGALEVYFARFDVAFD